MCVMSFSMLDCDRMCRAIDVEVDRDTLSAHAASIPFTSLSVAFIKTKQTPLQKALSYQNRILKDFEVR